MNPITPLTSFPEFANINPGVQPGDPKYSQGFVPSDTFPAEWANYLFNRASQGVTKLNAAVNSLWAEMNSVLSNFNINPDASVNNQLLTALRLSSTFLSASSTVITGPLLVSGGTIRVLFTADMAGTDTSTGFSVTYNGVNIPVKVYKDGTLQNFTASKISWQDTTAVYKYLDAGTTLELLYDSVQFIIVNNPIVLKSNRYTIYADGTVGGGNIASIKPSFTDTLDYGWLELNQRSLSRTEYPKLFSYFQTHLIGGNTMLETFGAPDNEHFYLPDTREVTLVGAGQNNTDTMTAHDVFSVNQYKDDQFQIHEHTIKGYTQNAILVIDTANTSGNNPGLRYQTTGGNYQTLVTNIPSGRAGDVTRGKRKGVKYIMKVL